MKKQEKKRAKRIERSIRLTWLSLKSHLPYTHKKLSKSAREDGESHRFHKKCVVDYAKVILHLSELY